MMEHMRCLSADKTLIQDSERVVHLNLFQARVCGAGKGHETCIMLIPPIESTVYDFCFAIALHE